MNSRINIQPDHIPLTLVEESVKPIKASALKGPILNNALLTSPIVTFMVKEFVELDSISGKWPRKGKASQDRSSKWKEGRIEANRFSMQSLSIITPVITNFQAKNFIRIPSNEGLVVEELRVMVPKLNPIHSRFLFLEWPLLINNFFVIKM